MRRGVARKSTTQTRFGDADAEVAAAAEEEEAAAEAEAGLLASPLEQRQSDETDAAAVGEVDEAAGMGVGGGQEMRVEDVEEANEDIGEAAAGSNLPASTSG